MTTRRFVLWTGVAGVALAGASLSPVLHSDLSKARAPWKAAGTGFDDPRLDALSYAVLAPNPHNRQPWLVRLDGEDALTLYCDPARLLRATDPYDRQIVIGLGAFLELLRQAAAEMGFAVEIEAFPEGEPTPLLDGRPVAGVRFVEAAQTPKDPLFRHISDRRTARGPFDVSKKIAPEEMTALDGVLGPDDGEFEWVSDAANVDGLKTICREAWRIELETPRTRKESIVLTRIGDDEINAAPDGISLSGPFIEGLAAAGLLTREKMDAPGARAYQATLDYYNRAIDTAMGFGWLSTAHNSRTDQLRAGAGWVRLQLGATARGLSMQPFSQALQEYPEMAEIFEEIHDFTGIRAPETPSAGRVQGLFRFGYSKPAPPSPRWPLETRLIPVEGRA